VPNELPAEWVEKARIFFENARRHLAEGHYWLTCFEAQQAAELYLKALVLRLTGVHPYTHDLVELMKAAEEVGLKVPSELKVYGDALTPHYTMARYPGRKPVSYTRDRGERCVEQARAIMEWVESVSDPRTSSYHVFASRLSSWERGFKAYVERLCGDPSVLEAYLVGSRARGDNLPGSDYDVLVAVRDGTDKLEAAFRLRRLRGEDIFPLDLIVVWESELNDPVYAEMLRGARSLCSRLLRRSGLHRSVKSSAAPAP
jgi:HEPN domain-containing protein/predicted nucleotidyltransferase